MIQDGGIAEAVKKRAGKKFRSGNWYTNALMNELLPAQKKNISEFETGFIVPGDLVFFLYSAKYPQKYPFWDRHPLSFILDVSPRTGHFTGLNVHYLSPQYRGGFVRSLINKTGVSNAPRKTIHKYLFSGVGSDLFKVPKNDWVDVSLLPTEQFVNKLGKTVPKYRVWDSP